MNVSDPQHDEKPKKKARKVNDRFNRFDAWFDSSLFLARNWLGRTWDAYSSSLERWRVRGFKRIALELVSDGTTVGLVLLAALFKYGVPPVDETGDVWNQRREIAVTFKTEEGQIIGRRGVRQDDAVPLAEVPPVVIKAVLATEDRRFFDHIGLDFQGTARAMLENVRASNVVQGGSTITQQLAKNLFLTPERTLKRKLHEAFLALWIEARLSKEEILKLYLDRAYLGAGTYGVEAASQFYFGKSIRDVSLPEAALLAGLFKAPSSYAPHLDPDAARGRASVVLDRMVSSGFISEGEAFAARREPAEYIKRDGYETPDYFLDFAYAEVQELIQEYKLENEYNFEVTTTIDHRLQKVAQATINNTLDVNSKAFGVEEAALVSMTTDGAVKAVVGGRDYEKSQFNRATDAKRQPGSAFKPFVYLAALRSGLRPSTVLTDSPIRLGDWQPKNYTHRYSGPVSLTTALKKSINTIPVHIAQMIGRDSIIETAKLVGLQSPLSANRSMPLGTNEVTVMDLTGAYAAFANGGRAVKPYATLEIRTSDGTLLYSRDRNSTDSLQAVNPVYIADLNYMMNQVVLSGTGRRAFLKTTPVAGKTGTTQGYRDAWFVGFTARHVTGVWFGNDDFTPMKRVTGGRLPAQTWHDFMVNAERGGQPAPLPGVSVAGGYVAADDTLDDASELALLEASSRDPVVKVLYNMAGLFRNAQGQQARPSVDGSTRRYDSFAEFRVNNNEDSSWFGSNDKRKKKKRRKVNKRFDVWNKNIGEGGYR